LKSDKRKITAPIIITIIMILYFIIYFGILVYFLSGVWKYILSIIPFVFTIIMIAVCVDRIKEIKKGEENDISKY